MNVVCLDMEGVLVPEIWIAFSEASGIPELARTTRDEPDYDKLMRFRLGILRERGLGLREIRAAAPLVAADGGLREARVCAPVERRPEGCFFAVVVRREQIGEHAVEQRAFPDMAALAARIDFLRRRLQAENVPPEVTKLPLRIRRAANP